MAMYVIFTSSWPSRRAMKEVRFIHSVVWVGVGILWSYVGSGLVSMSVHWIDDSR